MAAQVGALRVTVGADITGLQTGMRRAQRQVAQSAGVMQKSVAGVTTSFKSMGAMFGVALGGAALVGATRGLLRIADASKQLQAQLKLATQEYGSFAQANKDVRAIAERSRSDLLATGELYAGIQRQAGRFGVTQQQTARVVETLTKSLKISGATAQESAQALRQFGQAFTQGNLNSDEFRTMREVAPRAMKAIADSTGQAEGALKKLSAEGKLTSDILVKAFTDTKITEGIDADFAQLPVTFDEAMGQIYNAAVLTFGAFDQGGQFSTAIANFITGGTQGFAELEASAHSFGVEIRAVMDGIGAAFQSARDTGTGAFGDIEISVFSLRDALYTIFGVIDGLKNAFANLFQAPANLARLVSGQAPVIGSSNLAGAFQSAANKSRLDAARRRIMGRDADDVLAEFGMGRAPPPFVAPPGKEKKKKGRKGPSAETLAARARREMEQKLRRDAAFAAEERQNQIALLRAEQDLTSDYTKRSDLALRILAIELQQELAQIDLAQKLGDRTEVEAEALRLQAQDLNQLQHEAVLREQEAKQREEAAQLEDTRHEVVLDQLQAESALATTAEEARAIQLRILDHQYELERLALERILADRDATAAAKEDARIRLAALGARHSAERAGVVAGTRGPLEAWAASVPQTAAQIKEAFQSIQVDAIEGLADAITGLIDGTKSLAESFSEMARSIISDIIAMTVRMLIFRVISGMIGGGGGGAGGINVTGFGSPQSFPTPRAAGGPVTPGRTYLVGEQGPELVRMGGHGQVIPNHEINSGQVQVHVVPSPYFDVRVRQLSGQVVQATAPQIVRTAASATMRAAARPKLMGRG